MKKGNFPMLRLLFFALIITSRSALGQAPNVSGHADQAGAMYDRLVGINDLGFSRSFNETFDSFDSRVLMEEKKGGGILFFGFAEKNLSTGTSELKMFVPVATGADLKSTLVQYFIQNKDGSYAGYHEGFRTAVFYAFAKANENGEIKRELVSDELYKAAHAAANENIRIRALRKEGEKDQNRVDREQWSRQKEHDAIKQKQRDAENLKKLRDELFSRSTSGSLATTVRSPELIDTQSAAPPLFKPDLPAAVPYNPPQFAPTEKSNNDRANKPIELLKP
jgi:hypothetical protein